jgi:cell division protein ZapE
VTAVAARYAELLAAGELRPDLDQQAAVAVLDRLAVQLTAPRPKRGLLARLTRRAAPAAPRGIYMWGGVGRGKSMLMDLAYSSIALEPKRRVHFHEFMIEVHARLRAERAKAPQPRAVPALHRPG